MAMVEKAEKETLLRQQWHGEEDSSARATTLVKKSSLSTRFFSLVCSIGFKAQITT